MEALGEVRGGEEAALRRPPNVLAPHRPRPMGDILGGNGQRDGEITVAEARHTDSGEGAPPSPDVAEGDGSGDSGAAN